MHLDNELRALKPEVGRPSAVITAGHRGAVDAAIAQGRTERGRGRPGRGRPRWTLAAAAVLAVVAAGGVSWWATRSGDVRLDTGPGGPPAAGPRATSTDPTATTVHDGGVGSGAGAADQATATVTIPAGTGLACGPGTPTGGSLPGFLQLLPDEPAAAGSAAFDGDGRLVTRREGGGLAVEAMWPAPDRLLYARDGGADTGAGTDLGNFSTLVPEGGGPDVVVEGPAGQVTALRVLISGSVEVADPCRYVQLTVSTGGQVTARFSYDLAAEDPSAAIVDTGPLVVETRQAAAPPADAVPCGGGDDAANGTPANDDEAVRGPVASTPAEALEAFLATPAAGSYYQSGYVELITPDGGYTYGAPLDGDPSRWVTLVTVAPVDGGWAATHVTASGC